MTIVIAHVPVRHSSTRESFSVIPGGRYRARQADDGTWDVLNIPVFSTVPKGTKGAPRDITEEDLRLGVEVHQRLYREDRFLARANVLHNYGPHRPTPAGFFLPHSVGTMRMKGELLPVIFADLLAVPGEVFREIDRYELPYCSVEVRSYEPLSFGALALLDTEPPFFEFPLITIGMKHENATRVRVESEEPSAALAYAGSSDSGVFLFRFEEVSMADDEKDKKEGEGQMAAEDGGPDVTSVVKAIKSGAISVKDFAAIKEAMDAVAGATEPEESPEGPVDEPVSAMAADTVAKREIGRLSGRVAGLEEYRERTEREKQVQARFSGAVERLKADGYHVTEGTRNRLFAQAQIGDEAVQAIVETIRESVVQDPPEELSFRAGASGSAFPAEVMAFQSEGPEKFSAAQKAFAVWRAFPADRYRTPLDRYLKREVS